MIIAQITGGLGNQMFQYASSRALSVRNNTELKLDISAFGGKKGFDERGISLWDYGLTVFTLSSQVATAEECASLKKEKKRGLAGKLARLTSALSSKTELTHYKEPHFQFDPDFLKLGSNVYVEGYRQSEKYFKDFEEHIRRDFRFKEDASGRNKELISEMRSRESVSLHVRRGDYVSSEAAQKMHGSCSLEYYERAIEIIKGKVASPNLYVFSDDIAWVRENLKAAMPVTYVDHNNDKAHEDMRLMSSCKHNIIANSSFSWWGAWLSENKNKIVIAPGKWFARTDKDTRDVIPEAWIKL